MNELISAVPEAQPIEELSYSGDRHTLVDIPYIFMHALSRRYNERILENGGFFRDALARRGKGHVGFMGGLLLHWERVL